VSTVQDGTRASEYLLAISELEPMANVVSENASKIQFPPSVEAIFDRVISGHKEVNRKHASLPRYKRNFKKDNSHEYIISVVERAYDKLKPYITVKPHRRKHGAPAPTTLEPAGVAMENRFSGLTVDDTPESSETRATRSTEEAEDAPPEMPPVRIGRDEDELEDEFHFQILLLIEELHKIIQVVLNLWGAYRAGQLDVVVPSLATNIAIVLVRQAEADLTNLLCAPRSIPPRSIRSGHYPLSFTLVNWNSLTMIQKRIGSSLEVGNNPLCTNTSVLTSSRVSRTCASTPFSGLSDFMPLLYYPTLKVSRTCTVQQGWQVCSCQRGRYGLWS
jgi:hypothetical protein